MVNELRQVEPSEEFDLPEWLKSLSERAPTQRTEQPFSQLSPPDTDVARQLESLQGLVLALQQQSIRNENAIRNMSAQVLGSNRRLHTNVSDVMQHQQESTRAEFATKLRTELDSMQRRSFWPRLFQNFAMNLLFFLLGVVVTTLTTGHH